jgi:16S rRNA (guanine527-N7)-methyltransferase
LETTREILVKGLRILEIYPDETTVDRFVAYCSELKKWNRTYNLTALESDEDIVIKHFLDSLLYLTFIPVGRLSICDIGSGAGFPGLPIALIRPELAVALVEPSRKKCAFLKHMKRTLSLQNIEVLESRIEEVKHRSFDIAVTRALFSIADLVKKAGHVIKKGGFIIVSKGPRLDEELRGLPPGVNFEVKALHLPLAPLKRSLIKLSIAG